MEEGGSEHCIECGATGVPLLTSDDEVKEGVDPAEKPK